MTVVYQSGLYEIVGYSRVTGILRLRAAGQPNARVRKIRNLSRVSGLTNDLRRHWGMPPISFSEVLNRFPGPPPPMFAPPSFFANDPIIDTEE